MLALVAGLRGGCSLLPFGADATLTPEDQLPPGVPVPVPPDQMRLDAINGTTIPVVLVVNGKSRDMAPGDAQHLGIGDLGPLPWDARFQTRAGRHLAQVTVHEGDVVRQHNADGSTELHSAGSRVDLSCGQLILMAGWPGHGPAPGKGTPGDCD